MRIFKQVCQFDKESLADKCVKSLSQNKNDK